MDKQPFALCLRNPMLPKPLVLWKRKDETRYDWGVERVRKAKQVVAYDFSCLLNNFRERKLRRLPHVVDVQTAKRLCVGKPRSELRSGSEPWSIVKLLGEHVIPQSREWLAAFVKLETLDSPPEKILRDIMEALATVWGGIVTELQSKSEADRFYEVEVPTYNLFLKTELTGIHVDKARLAEMLTDLKRQRFRSYKRLELEYGFVTQQISPRMSFADIREHVSLTCDEEDFENDFWRKAELLAEHDDFLSNLVTAHRSRIESDALLRYSVEPDERVFPRFDVMGTVTGRVMMPSPGIQYLRKTSRAIFRAAKGKKFLYADFDQFEPGIVASLSGDTRLTEIYNRGDIYEKLSETLFNDVGERKLAKTIFLAYLYGMTRERLVALVGKASHKATPAEYVRSFFTQFKQLNEWKESLCDTAKKNGFAESVFGNRRYLADKGSLSPKEKRWVPNQLIQGTASLIFKRALIELHKAIGNRAAFLIPMHDAILLEVAEADEKEVRSAVTQVFCEEFARVCPRIVPGVSFEEFAAT